MVYLIVAIALIFLTVKGFCGKKTSTCVTRTSDAFRFNILRMLLCMMIGIVVVFLEGAQKFLRVDNRMIAICLLAGVCNAMFLIGWILAIRKNSMVTMDVALTLGAILPAVLCAIFYDEPISVPKLVGFALIIAAAAILAGYNKSTKGNPVVGGILLVVIASVGVRSAKGLSALRNRCISNTTLRVAVWQGRRSIPSRSIIFTFTFLPPLH